MNNPERGCVLLTNHRDHAFAGREKIVSRVVGQRWTHLAMAPETEQDRSISTGRDGNLVSVKIGVTAVERPGVFPISRIVERINLLHIGARFPRLHPLYDERIIESCII
jgi:hypothetical protein